ncbi:hypothetical protein R2F61_02225 [Mollicutes bacterium LVI A0078]|nr:hypothetical protein RZE84_02255 [Mollicutes bacterium LVI A0075]WOO91385.1 hypothetical protein R2F61_02225 [Mollicutes bacterium LVI A0078]
MNENPFESKKGKTSSFEQTERKPNKLVTIIIFIIVVVVAIALASVAVDKYQEYKFNQSIDNIYNEDLIGDISIADIQSSGQTFIGPDDLLGKGSETSLKPKQATDVFEPSFIEKGNSYRYHNVVEPGVYTVKYKSGSEVVFGNKKSFRSIGYQIGAERQGTVMNEFHNLAITEGDELFIESEDEDFELEFIPQTEYVQFDSNNIQPGVYVAGQTIDSGKYQFASANDEAVVITLQTEDGVELISSEDYPTFNLKEGYSIVIDDENTVITKA